MTYFVICINNEGYEASLERGKVYQVVNDPLAASRDMLRIGDESGEDYLFPATRFVSIKLPQKAQDALVV